jgi:carbonic anhydrase
VCQTTIVRQAWAREQELTIHGWIYGLSDGLLRDLDIGIRSQEEVPEVYRSAVATLSTT